MSLKQQIIRDRTERLSDKLGIDKDRAFLQLIHTLITNHSIYDFNEKDMCEGNQEKKIDAFTIETTEKDHAIIYITQTVNTTSFPTNDLVLLNNGLCWIFNKTKEEVNKLKNENLKERIIELRSLQSELGPSNLEIIVSFVTNGDVKKISEDFTQEKENILSKFDNGTFFLFKLNVWGADEILDRIKFFEKKGSNINEKIKFIHDINNPSLIKYESHGLKGVVCTVDSDEIARVVNNSASLSIFDEDIRNFLGLRGSVNSEIFNSCSNKDINNLFWFLNNGITIVCDKCEPILDPDNPLISIENMRIVNGCQTASTIANAMMKGVLQPKTRVMLRIYETSSPDLIDRIVLSTNSQNRITNRDIKSNDSFQTDFETAFAKYNLYFERKPRQYDTSTVDPNLIVSNEIVAQCFLANVLGKPSDSRSRKYKVWGQYYKDIFSGEYDIEPYIISFLIYKRINEFLSTTTIDKKNEVQKKIINSARFHLLRITSLLWRENDQWKKRRDKDQKFSQQLIKNTNDLLINKDILNDHILESIVILEEILSNNNEYKNDLEVALKSSNVDEEINKHFYALMGKH
ncbi:MAG: AIPR family protein [Candidatus Methanofastidiosa archaeon]|nr:AIPR family protein [Candidatus Methanofastidiosa archaeon]